MIGIRRMIEAQVLGLTGMALKEIDFERPKGEPGLFGPQSAIWQVHGDFTSMLCGGISALLLQMLHPLALAGVWDHSRFREDILGRLRRTITPEINAISTVFLGLSVVIVTLFFFASRKKD